MKIHELLIDEIKLQISQSQQKNKLLQNYLKENKCRLIKELDHDQGLDILCALDENRYLEIKEEIIQFDNQKTMERSISILKELLEKNPHIYIKIEENTFDRFNYHVLVSKKINVNVTRENNNSPFHNFVKNESMNYFISSIIKCGIENVDAIGLIKRFEENGCQIIKITHPDAIFSALNGIC